METAEKEQMLKAMREATAKRIEDNKMSRARLDPFASAAKPMDEGKAEVVTNPPPVKPVEAVAPAVAAPSVDTPATVKKSEAPSPAPLPLATSRPVSEATKESVVTPASRDSFVTAAEKERMLRSIRDAAAKEVEDKAALRSRLEQVAAAEKAADEKKAVAGGEAVPPAVAAKGGDTVEVIAVETAVTPAEVAAAFEPVSAETPPTLESVQPGTLVPPPPRPTAGAVRHKPEMRTAAQTRINEAYLRQLKGEEPLAETEEPKKPVPPPRRASSRPRPSADGSRQVPVESLGTGLFNALGDMVGGVVHLTRALGGGVKKVVAPDPASQASGTAQMADKMVKGVRGVFTGAGEIVKGSGNIVVGTLGVVTMPVVEAVGAVIHSVRSPGHTEEAAKESAASSQPPRNS